MTDELKPCPFCGGKATYAKAARGWKVECEGRMGSCTMNARTHYQPHKFLAIAAWNTRADLEATASPSIANPLADPLVAALVEAATELHDKAVEKHQRHRSDIWPVIRKLRAALDALEENK